MAALTIVLTWGIAMIITALLGIWLIPMLRRMKFGQTILDIGPRWHKDKQGTPTMGGIMFIAGISVAVIAGFILIKLNVTKDLFSSTSRNTQILFSGLVMALAFALVGFLDDFIKIRKKQNEGLTEKQKLLFQFVITIGYMISLRLLNYSTEVWIPFLGHYEFGFLYYVFSILGIIYMVNVVNLTDGIDGLCSSVTLISAIGFLIIATNLSRQGMQVMASALAGGCMGFLIWNLHPAKVFMGDTGSFFFGGCIVALAYGLEMPAIIIFMGMVYIIEGVTVLIQTTYFKYTRRKTGEGKRLFKMTPIHHHFEMSGWSENKIVIVFSLLQVVFCALGVLAVLNM